MLRQRRCYARAARDYYAYYYRLLIRCRFDYARLCFSSAHMPLIFHSLLLPLPLRHTPRCFSPTPPLDAIDDAATRQRCLATATFFFFRY